ncbi:MAG: GNAT family N-acetyltransferase [Pseudomonadales bacterium]
MSEFVVSDSPPSDLRGAYLDGLAEPQELYLEQLVAVGQSWRVADIAYVVIHGETLVEFYVRADHARSLVALFDAAMAASGARRILCKSYDTSLLYAAPSAPAAARPGGLLFRRYDDQTFKPRSDVSLRRGLATDAKAILRFNDDFFESMAEIQSSAARGGLFVLENESGIIGCGVATQVIEGRPDVDIGMLIAAPHRRQGYATHIVSFLKHHYVNMGMRPICGCSVDNVGSARALERAGFVSEHRLLEITPG